MSNEEKKTWIIHCISSSCLSQDAKQELINYVESHDEASVRAAFRLGQMDMQASAAAAIRSTAPDLEYRCRTCTMNCANLVEHLEVI